MKTLETFDCLFGTCIVDYRDMVLSLQVFCQRMTPGGYRGIVRMPAQERAFEILRNVEESGEEPLVIANRLGLAPDDQDFSRHLFFSYGVYHKS